MCLQSIKIRCADKPVFVHTWSQFVLYSILFQLATDDVGHCRHTGMLENFHNILLAYCAKRTAFRYIQKIMNLFIMICFQ